MQLADALKVHNAINGLYVSPSLRKNFTVTVRVVQEYEVKIKAPDKDIAEEIASGLVQAGLAGECTSKRESTIRQEPSGFQIELQRQRLFSRGIGSDRLSFSREIDSGQ